MVYEFQSTPPSRVATKDDPIPAARGMISIHTTLAGGDILIVTRTRNLVEFQSTPPSRVATFPPGLQVQSGLFQSTPPSRVATDDDVQRCYTKRFQSTPPSRVATKQQFAVVCKVVISIHTTLAGGDAKNMNTQVTELQISIHTTLAGGDTPIRTIAYSHPNFNPHHPRGWRHAHFTFSLPYAAFQSTPPSRVATWPSVRVFFQLIDFNPHHPRGWRQQVPALGTVEVTISIHTTLAGGDPDVLRHGGLCHRNFNPHHPRGWRPCFPRPTV